MTIYHRHVWPLTSNKDMTIYHSHVWPLTSNKDMTIYHRHVWPLTSNEDMTIYHRHVWPSTSNKDMTIYHRHVWPLTSNEDMTIYHRHVWPSTSQCHSLSTVHIWQQQPHQTQCSDSFQQSNKPQLVNVYAFHLFLDVNKYHLCNFIILFHNLVFFACVCV